MFGTSYSGFNSLQMAAMRPPALKAIIPIYATDRRYTDDVHYGGGMRRGIDFLDYPMNMVAMNALPPVPSVYGEGWREEWMRRIEANEPWELPWLEQQEESEYWRHGSVSFDGYEQIEAATMIVAGHADGYRNMAFRGFERLRGPKRLVFGPWSHMSPRLSMPGPRVDHVPEMIRWWRRWLAGDDNGVDREPPIQLFMRRATQTRARPGRPPGRLAGRAGVATRSACESGRTSSSTPNGSPAATRTDARRRARGSRRRRRDRIDLVRGRAAVRLPVGPACRRVLLADLRPGLDGHRARDRRAPARGAPRVVVHPGRVRQREALRRVPGRHLGFDHPRHREPHPPRVARAPVGASLGEPVQISLELDATAYVLGPGHQLRLDLAGADFPSSWPPPHAGTLTIDPATSRLVLPVLEGPPEAEPPVFAVGAQAPHRPDRVTWMIEDDVLARVRRVRIEHGGVRGQAGDTRIFDTYGGEIGVSTVDPGRAWATGATSFELSFPEATVRAASSGTLRTEDDAWHLTLDLEVFENDRQIAHRHWERSVPRGLH